MLAEFINQLLGISSTRGHGKMCHMRRKWAHRLLFVWERQCGYCRRKIDPTHFTIDHFVPRASGGKNRLENWVPVCTGCNCDKDSREPYAWMRERGIDVAAFDARRARWCTYLFEFFQEAARGEMPPGPLTFRLAIPQMCSPGSSDSG